MKLFLLMFSNLQVLTSVLDFLRALLDFLTVYPVG